MRFKDWELLFGAWRFSCNEIIQNQHGIIANYFGDGFLAYWPEGSTSPEEIVAVLLRLRNCNEKESPRFALSCISGASESWALHRGAKKILSEAM